MNPAILVREKVGRLVTLLTEKKIRVQQRGSRAYVEFDGNGVPKLVNIPYIPDDASPEFLAAIEGFLDHEVAHVLFTDYRVLIEAKKRGVANLHNIIEDAFIEKMMARTFAGSGLNLRNVGEFFLKSYTDKALRDEPEKAVGVLMVPAIRALSGQDVFAEYMKGKWHHLDAVMAKIGEIAKEKLPLVASSKDALDVALLMQKALDSRPPKPATPPPAVPAAKMAAAPAPTPEEPEDEDEPKEPGDPVDEEADGDGTPAPGDDSDFDDPEDEPSELDDTESEPGDEGEDADGDAEDGAGGPGEEGAGEEMGAGERTESDEEEAEGTPFVSPESEDYLGDEEPGGVTPTSGELEASLEDSDYDEKLAELLSKTAAEESKGADYLVYTKDLDKIEPLVPEEACRWHDSMLSTMQDRVDHMVGPLQKDLERAVAAKSRAVWSAGHRSGRLHGGALARLTAFKDDRAFRRRHIADTKDVAVTLLIDSSGSMGGDGKIETASYAAYGLSQVLDRLGISHEVLAFTTGVFFPNDMRDEEAKLGVRYSRYKALVIPIIKDFSEHVSTTVKRRFAALSDANFMDENVDGESLQVAATRLLVRREKRKILIVLSDGQPACPSGRPAGLVNHLKKTVKDIERQGVDVLGVGICSSAPKNYYSKCVLLNRVEDLPGEVMGSIKKLLMQ